MFVDISWLLAGLWFSGGFAPDIVVVYFFVLFLAAMGQSILLVVGAGIFLAGADLAVLAIGRDDSMVWSSFSLIRVPFIFIAALFYGYVVDNVRRAQQQAFIEKELAEKMGRVVHAQTLDLRMQADELREVNARMAEQAVRLEKSNKAKDEFLNVVSHELRTPLNVISGYAEMIKDGTMGDVSSAQEGALLKIMGYAAELLKTVNTILEAARLDADTGQAEVHEISLGDLLDGIRSSFNVVPGKKCTLIWDYPSDLPVVATDSRKLRNILENLINNAIKFCEQGEVRISVRPSPESKTVQFKVTDTGIGIPKESLPVIFDKFYQVDSSETRTHEGVGLGLYIVRRYTELLKGTIDVESEYGKGCTFTLVIPFSVEQVS